MSQKTVLCVDDELNILKSVQRLLRKEDYRLLTASSAEEGLTILEQETVHLVVSDHKMPGMSGIDFLKLVKKKYPKTIRIILSGYAEIHIVMDAINQGEVYRFMTKPWNDEELIMTITQCLEQYDICELNRTMAEELNEKNRALKHVNHQLEMVVERRTDFLRFSQELITALPIPIVGVSVDGDVVLLNHAFQTEFSTLSGGMVGSHIDTVLPESLCEQINTSINSLEPMAHVIDEQKTSVQICPLNGGKTRCGSILLFTRDPQ